jgi:hypothetical protein
MEVLDNVDGREEGTVEAGMDVVLEIVDPVEIVEDVGFETKLVVVVAKDEGF